VEEEEEEEEEAKEQLEVAGRVTRRLAAPYAQSPSDKALG
jgi:hypothetical protein